MRTLLLILALLCLTATEVMAVLMMELGNVWNAP